VPEVLINIGWPQNLLSAVKLKVMKIERVQNTEGPTIVGPPTQITGKPWAQASTWMKCLDQ